MPTALLTTVFACAAAFSAAYSRAQNDWQFPDPYFGILEFEKSRPPVEARPGVATAPAPRRAMQRQRVLRPRRRYVLQTPRP